MNLSENIIELEYSYEQRNYRSEADPGVVEGGG